MVQSRIKRDLGSSPSARCAAVFCASIVCMAGAASAQQPAEDTRAARVAAEQQEKAKQLKPYEPNKAEVWVAKLEEQFITGSLHWHPFFTSAYAGGGFTLGAGYSTHVSSYNTIDVRGSYTFSGYKRIESEFVAPRLFGRRGRLSVLGGWREATSVGFYGIGTDNTSKDDRTNYSFKQPYASAMLDVRPRRKALVFGGGVEYSQWDQGPGDGSAPSVDEVYTPATLPGLDATVTYLHTQGTAALDWRTSAGYSRRGGYYGVTVHDYADTRRRLQLSAGRLRCDPASPDLPGRCSCSRCTAGSRRPTRSTTTPFPSSCCRRSAAGRACAASRAGGFATVHSLLLQAEWRVLVNGFFDMALFYDAGKVTARRVGPRPRRLEDRLRHRLPPAWPGWPHRCASSWPRATRGSSSSSRRRPRSKAGSCASNRLTVAFMGTLACRRARCRPHGRTEVLRR